MRTLVSAHRLTVAAALILIGCTGTTTEISFGDTLGGADEDSVAGGDTAASGDASAGDASAQPGDAAAGGDFSGGDTAGGDTLSPGDVPASGGDGAGGDQPGGGDTLLAGDVDCRSCQPGECGTVTKTCGGITSITFCGPCPACAPLEVDMSAEAAALAACPNNEACQHTTSIPTTYFCCGIYTRAGADLTALQDLASQYVAESCEGFITCACALPGTPTCVNGVCQGI